MAKRLDPIFEVFILLPSGIVIVDTAQKKIRYTVEGL